MRNWLISATIVAAATATGGATTASAQSSVQVSATIVAAVTPPASIEQILPGGRFEVESPQQSPFQGSQLLHSVVRSTTPEPAHVMSAASTGPSFEVVKKGAGSVFERSKPAAVTAPGEARPVVVTWTIAANA